MCLHWELWLLHKALLSCVYNNSRRCIMWHQNDWKSTCTTVYMPRPKWSICTVQPQWCCSAWLYMDCMQSAVCTADTLYGFCSVSEVYVQYTCSPGSWIMLILQCFYSVCTVFTAGILHWVVSTVCTATHCTALQLQCTSVWVATSVNSPEQCFQKFNADQG